MTTKQFVHLRVHSEFSLVDSVIKLKALVQKTVEYGMPAIALTDQSNFYGVVKFYKAATSSGIKPIIGSDFLLLDDDEGETSLLTLLAMNDEGYRNIIEIISLAYIEGQSLGVPKIKWQWLEQFNGGVIALSGAKYGRIGKALLNDNVAQAEAVLQQFMSVFPNRFYLELQRTSRVNDENYLHKAIAIAKQYACPVVATNDVRFISAKEFEAHEVRVCIHDSEVLGNPKRSRNYSREQYLRTPEEMCELFADIPSAIQNTVEIAKRCNVKLTLGEYSLPTFRIKDPKYISQNLTEDEYLRIASHEGLAQRLEFLFGHSPELLLEKEPAYRERLDFELNVILEMGFPGYFLIVSDFISEAKKMDVPVGPGRGSGAGSLVAYSLGITDLDPLEYDLLFERFLNPERVSMPDFDVDFCMEKRGEVIRYVIKEYGRMAVSQIITFGTMAAKAVIRDVARVLGKSYGLADRLSKLIPFVPGMTLEKAIEIEEGIKLLLEQDPDAQEIWDMSRQLEGTVRGVGKHAGGVVIAPTKITDFSPVYCAEELDQNDDDLGLVSQYDKGDVESVGLVKFDFLGLRTLTIIDWALKIINRQLMAKNKAAIEILAIPLDDKPTYQLLQAAETTAVFQLESRGMKELIKRLKPDNIEDLIALVALFRPGPLDSGMVDDFVNRKHGRAKVAYPDAQYQHECLKPILEPTYGVIVYQEQVMQIAQELAGYSLGGADLLRRAMGKKDADEMARQRSVFGEGAQKKGVDPELATKIFDLVEKFAGYGFNKSHSAAYALVSYQTAWLKTHYPAPFMAAVLSSELQDTDKIVTFIEECRRMKIPLVNPDVNCGEYRFTVNQQNQIVHGLGAIKGLGEGPVDSLIQARNAGGPFKNLFDFCVRVDLRKVNKRALEALIKSGSFDTLGESRAVLMASLTEAVHSAEQQSQNIDAGMDDLFGVVDTNENADPYAHFRHVEEWSLRERLQAEKDTLGLYLTGHPIDEYEQDLERLNCKRLMHLEVDKRSQLVAGLIIGVRFVKTKSGKKMAIIHLDDRTARIEVTVFAKLLPDIEHKLNKDEIVFIRGEVEADEFSGGHRMRCESVTTMTEMRGNSALKLHLHLHSSQWNATQQEQLHSVLQESEEGCRVVVHYQTATAQCQIKLPQQWRIAPEDDTIQQLKRWFGEQNVQFQ
jgi:DNA polymerase-3 subunit alpha